MAHRPKLAEQFDKPLFVPDIKLRCTELATVRNVGLEVEVEQLSANMVDGWRLEPDHSLRDGVEYVFDGPAQGKDVISRIDNLYDYLSKRKHSFTDRCSIHVHVDITDLDNRGLRKLILLYALFEPWLIEMCGSTRTDNVYCLPLVKTKGMVRELSRFVLGGRIRESMLTSDYRYGGFTLSSLRQFGTVEFRSMCGTDDKQLLIEWIDILTRIVDYASISPLSTSRFIYKLHKKGVESMLIEVLGKDLYLKHTEKAIEPILFDQGLSTLGALTVKFKDVDIPSCPQSRTSFTRLRGKK